MRFLTCLCLCLFPAALSADELPEVAALIS